MSSRGRVVAILLLWVTTTLAGANAHSVPVDTGGWAYPQQAVIDSDPAVIGEYVTCLFDVDQHGNFRAIEPDVEATAQSQAKRVINSAASSSESQKLQVSLDIFRLMLSALSPDKIIAAIKR